MRGRRWNSMHSTSSSIASEIPARGRRLSLRRYGSESEGYRCCCNRSSRFAPGFGCCISSLPASPRLVSQGCFALGRGSTLRLLCEPRHRCGQPLPPSVPCSGAARSFPRQHAVVRGSVDGAAHNRSVEATSNGWPHMASCSFSALCSQPLDAPRVER
jgi:hypothetical protein